MYYAIKTCRGVDCADPRFLNLGTSWDEWSASLPCHFTPGERAPGTHWIGGWVDLRAGLDNMEKWKFLALPGLEPQPLGRPAHNQSLYRLCCRLFSDSVWDYATLDDGMID
jgi:hypothetical protein